VTLDLTPNIGSEIKIDRDGLLRGDHAREIRALLERRGVLVIRGMHLDRDEQLAFTATLGTPQLQGGRDVMPVSLDARHHQGREHLADYLRGAFFWHIDGSADEAPNLANMLTAVQLSDEGGQTQFANTYAAYEALPDEEKRALDRIRVVHSIETSQRYIRPEPSFAELQGWRRYTPRSHPLVWTHRSGRKSLVLGSTASYVEGLSPEDSYALLTRLRDWATQDRFVYAHDWTVGDLVIWDNTGTMHRVTPYDPASGRLMNRTVLAGEEALV
jgi:alpha-ketoglutarate-dependent taurine dioxygenase